MLGPAAVRRWAVVAVPQPDAEPEAVLHWPEEAEAGLMARCSGVPLDAEASVVAVEEARIGYELDRAAREQDWRSMVEVPRPRVGLGLCPACVEVWESATHRDMEKWVADLFEQGLGLKVDNPRLLRQAATLLDG